MAWYGAYGLPLGVERGWGILGKTRGPKAIGKRLGHGPCAKVLFTTTSSTLEILGSMKTDRFWMKASAMELKRSD